MTIDLAKFTVSNVRAREHTRGIEWSLTIKQNGLPVLKVEQAGTGGPNRYTPVGATSRDLAHQLDAAARALGLRGEALDSVTACANNGDTLAAAAAVALVEGF